MLRALDSALPFATSSWKSTWRLRVRRRKQSLPTLQRRSIRFAPTFRKALSVFIPNRRWSLWDCPQTNVPMETSRFKVRCDAPSCRQLSRVDARTRERTIWGFGASQDHFSFSRLLTGMDFTNGHNCDALFDALDAWNVVLCWTERRALWTKKAEKDFCGLRVMETSFGRVSRFYRGAAASNLIRLLDTFLVGKDFKTLLYMHGVGVRLMEFR